MAIIEDNREAKVKRGETGFILNATLKDDANDLLNLSLGGNWAVSIKVTARGTSTANLLAGSTMTRKDQTYYPGQAYYVFSSADALLPAGKYDLEITATEPGGRVHKFPKTPGSVFGTLHMMATNAS